MKEDNYKERSKYQLDEWVRGNSIHNDIDNECCPDFSCCQPGLLQPKEIRETFKALKKKSDNENEKEHPAYDQMMSMLYTFLGACVAEAVPDKKIYIIDGQTEVTKDLN